MRRSPHYYTVETGVMYSTVVQSRGCQVLPSPTVLRALKVRNATLRFGPRLSLALKRMITVFYLSVTINRCCVMFGYSAHRHIILCIYTVLKGIQY